MPGNDGSDRTHRCTNVPVRDRCQQGGSDRPTERRTSQYVHRSRQVIAHRGASKAAPENTVEAFALAGRMGADAVELDVRRTRDGALVVHHNPDLPDGRLIRDVDAADLPSSVPTLGAALDACAGDVGERRDQERSRARPTSTRPTSIADETMALLLARDEHDRWRDLVVPHRDDRPCRAIADAGDAAPIRTAWLTASCPTTSSALLHRGGHVALHPWVSCCRREMIDAVSRRGHRR